MTQRILRILLIAALLPGMLAGLGADRVLCVGADGHMALEPAAMSSDVGALKALSCAMAVDSSQHLAFTCSAGRGACTDISGASAVRATERGCAAPDRTLAQAVPPIIAFVFKAEEPADSARMAWPADTPAWGRPLLRSVVLLI